MAFCSFDQANLSSGGFLGFRRLTAMKLINFDQKKEEENNKQYLRFFLFVVINCGRSKKKKPRGGIMKIENFLNK